ncbi:hypothetical protein IJV79_04755 [bacterium]|nr:hypothetical protein [bacterium]
MKPLDSSMFNNLKTKAFGKFSKGLGSMLILTSALGWGLASTAQVFGILKNDKYSKDEKAYLVRQEIADGALNILSFCAITTGCKNLSRMLVDSGKIMTPKIDRFCKKQGFDLSKPKSSISKYLNDGIENCVQRIKSAQGQDVKQIRQEMYKLRAFNNQTFKPFESGAEVFGTLAGGIVASNIITPICRNKIAAHSLNRKAQQQTYPQRTGSMKV